MRVLLDENLPHDLAQVLIGHDVVTVQGLGWAGTLNGELLRRASGIVEVIVTMDRKLPHQHNLPALHFGVIVIAARSNRMDDLLPIVDQLLRAITESKAGQVTQVGTL